MLTLFGDNPELKDLYRNGRYAEGRAISEQLLAEARERDDEPAILQNLAELAEFLFHHDAFDAALACREEMRDIHSRQSAGAVTQDLVDDLTKIGFYHECAARLDTAEEYSRQALQLAEQLPPEERRDIPWLLLNLSHHLSRRGGLNEALEMVKDAWRMRTRYDRDNATLGLFLFLNFTDLLERTGQFAKARKHTLLGLRCHDRDDLPIRYRTTLARFYRFHARLLYQNGELAAARSALVRALELIRISDKPEHPSAVSLAQVCRNWLEQLDNELAVAEQAEPSEDGWEIGRPNRT